MRLRYRSPIPDNGQQDWEFIRTSTKSGVDHEVKDIFIIVTSPRFYTRLFCYGNLKAAILAERHLLDGNSQRVQLDSDSFSEFIKQPIFQDTITPTEQFELYKIHLRLRRIDQLRWEIVKILRRGFTITVSSTSPKVECSIRNLDKYLFQNADPNSGSIYVRAVLRALLTENYGFGDELYLKFMINTIWFLLFACAWFNMRSEPPGFVDDLKTTNLRKSSLHLEDGYQFLASGIYVWLLMFGLQVWWMIRITLDI